MKYKEQQLQPKKVEQISVDGKQVQFPERIQHKHDALVQPRKKTQHQTLKKEKLIFPKNV